MDADWGACYYEHFAHYMHEPVECTTYKHADLPHSLQILTYDNVFDACRVFCTFGVSHYPAAAGHRTELCVVADAGWELIPDLMAKLLAIIIVQQLPLEPGIAFRGIQRLAPAFCAQFAKPALYILEPHAHGFPLHFSAVCCGKHHGRVLMGMFISEAEYQFFDTQGSDAFEQRLEDANIDPFDLRRRSAI